MLKLWPNIFMTMYVMRIATGITRPVSTAVPQSRRREPNDKRRKQQAR